PGLPTFARIWSHRFLSDPSSEFDLLVVADLRPVRTRRFIRPLQDPSSRLWAFIWRTGDRIRLPLLDPVRLRPALALLLVADDAAHPRVDLRERHFRIEPMERDEFIVQHRVGPVAAVAV